MQCASLIDTLHYPLRELLCIPCIVLDKNKTPAGKPLRVSGGFASRFMLPELLRVLLHYIKTRYSVMKHQYVAVRANEHGTAFASVADIGSVRVVVADPWLLEVFTVAVTSSRIKNAECLKY